ncbi:MAG: hypothetical protein FWD78_02905 [Treponema sp.]|nr:hypothetical protein [Treponema sp.]
MSYTAQRRKDEEDELNRYNLLKLQEEGNRLINNIENGLISNDDDNYLPEYEKLVNKLYQDALSTVKTPYGKRSLDYMFAANDARMRPALENATRIIQNKNRFTMENASNQMILAGDGKAEDKLTNTQMSRDKLFIDGNHLYSWEKYYTDSVNARSGSFFGDFQKEVRDAIINKGMTPGEAMEELFGKFRERLDNSSLDLWDAKGGWENLRPGELPTEGFQKRQHDTTIMDDRIMESARAYADEVWANYENIYVDKHADVIGKILQPLILEMGIMPGSITNEIIDNYIKENLGSDAVTDDVAALNERIKEKSQQNASKIWDGYVKEAWKQADAQISNTYGNVLTAVTAMAPNSLELVAQGLAEVSSFKNPLINPDDRNKYNKWYNDLLAFILKSDKNGSSGMADVINSAAVSGKLKELLTEVVSGRNTIFGSLQDFNQGFRTTLFEWARAEGRYGKDQVAFEAEFAGVLQQYWDFAKDIVGQTPEAMTALDMAKRYFDNLKDNNTGNDLWMGKKYQGVTDHARGAVLSGLWDSITSYDWRDPKRQGLNFLQNVTDMLGVINGETVQALVKPTNKQGDEILIDLVQALENPNIMHTDYEGRLITLPGPIGNTGLVGQKVSEAWDLIGQRIATAAGIDSSLLVAKPREDKFNYEKDAAPEFQYNGGSTWYRLVVDGDGRNKKLYLEKRTGLNGTWGNRTLLDQAAENRAADQAAREYNRERNYQIEYDNRDASRLANLEIGGYPAQMPGEYKGRSDDIMMRHEFINKYGVQNYIDFLKKQYRKPDGSLPEALQLYDRNVPNQGTANSGQTTTQNQRTGASTSLSQNFEQLRNTSDPEQRRDLFNKMKINYSSDDFLKEGINPANGSKMVMIQAADWDRILNGLVPMLRAVQESKWRQLGIIKAGVSR